jgi:hypothetical protein
MTVASLEIGPQTIARRTLPVPMPRLNVATAEHSPDWSGLWFKLVEEVSGEFTGGRFGKREPGASEIKWTFLPHAAYDGLGGFAHLLRQGPRAAEVRVPILKEKRRPPQLVCLAALVRYLMQKRQPAAAWKTFDASWTPPASGASAGTAVATRVLDVDRTERLSQMARAHGVSLNSFLLSALARASQAELGPGPATWMTPVNMRGPVARANDTANHTAYLQMELARDATPMQVHEQVKRSLLKREHWATWLFANAGCLVGYAGMRRIYNFELASREGRPFVGAFSNLGSWDGFGEWSVCPPVARSSPLGVGVIICDGKLSLTIDAHPSIARDAAWTRGFMERWLAVLGV